MEKEMKENSKYINKYVQTMAMVNGRMENAKYLILKKRVLMKII
jgi:hypothetical protein